MYFDFCVTGLGDGGPRLGLDTIFHVLGDHTYTTPHKEITPGKTYFVCTTQGEGTIFFDGQTIEVRQNDCMFLRPTQSFHYRCKEDCWHFWWFETRVAPPLFAANERFSVESNDFKLDLFAQSLVWAKRERWDVAENLFDAACGIMHHNLICQRDGWNSALFRSAEQYIRENLATVTVSDLCAALQTQERTLRNLFYHVQGHGPKQTIDTMRLDAAQQLLENTKLTICQIAQQLGYSSQFHFSRAFSQRFQLSPQQYRTRSQG